MKFKEYLHILNKLAKNRPEIMDLDVIYSVDIEGSSYKTVHFEPQIGYFNGEDFEEENVSNAICIN